MGDLQLVVVLAWMFVVSQSRAAPTDNTDNDNPCQKGWEPVGCNNDWKCGKPMSKFDSDGQCIKAGGVPEATACVTVNRSKVNKSKGRRFCIKDTDHGKIRFARNGKKMRDAAKDSDGRD